MTQQPEALRLAAALDKAPYSSPCTNDAAAELRRLEGEIERKSDAIQRLWKERDDLRAVNAQLLKALKVARREAICWYAESWGFDPEVDELPDWLIEIDAAIKAAKGEV
jgi:hypothetical protein